MMKTQLDSSQRKRRWEVVCLILLQFHQIFHDSSSNASWSVEEKREEEDDDVLFLYRFFAEDADEKETEKTRECEWLVWEKKYKKLVLYETTVCTAADETMMMMM